MKALLAILLAACGSKMPDEPPPKRPPAAPVSQGPMDMNEFVRVVEEAPPTEAGALQRWLIAGSYKGWVHESKQHPSAGPHAEAVITFLSPSLAQSLAAKRTAHPKGVSSVKELFKGGKHVGWAVSAKTSDDSALGKNWYWYEVLSKEPAAKAPYQGKGLEICRDCHTENGGVDQVLVDYPLQ